MICSKCGQPIKTKQEMQGLANKQKVALFVATQTDGTYPAEVAREVGISRSAATRYLGLLEAEREIYSVTRGSIFSSVKIFYPFIIVKQLAGYPEWSEPSGDGTWKSRFRASLVRRIDGSIELRVQQLLKIGKTEQGVSGICVPQEGLLPFLQTLQSRVQEIR